jgi:hypothetical protein
METNLMKRSTALGNGSGLVCRKGRELLLALTIIVACASSWARVSEACWHPGLTRNIGIAEQRCNAPEADKPNSHELRVDPNDKPSERTSKKPNLKILKSKTVL